MPTLHLLRENQRLECEHGANLYAVLAEHDLVDGPCGGKGICGKCRVLVDGNPTLACARAVEGDLDVVTEPKDDITDIQVSGYHIDVRPDPAAEGSYGVAVDIGTTTVVVTLVELATGRELRSASCLNAQKAYGQDVITRIHFTMDDPRGCDILAGLIRGDLNRLIAAVCTEERVDPARVERVVVSGNTTMIHLFAAVDPSSIAHAPFIPTLKGSVTGSAEDFGLISTPAARVFCVPCIAAYVGGDIVSGVLACDLLAASGRTLFIDIGTNGEIVLADGGSLVSCSCAAGPALEGMNISCGMRASAGAIEDVTIAGEVVSHRTIGGGHTVEAEAMGADVNLGDEVSVARAGKPICSSMRDVLGMELFDERSRRLPRMIEAARALSEAGEQAMYAISGPVSILSCLLDLRVVFREWRREPELVREVLGHLRAQVIPYALRAADAGVAYMEYADPPAAVSIVGPRVATTIAEGFTTPLIRELSARMSEGTSIFLCPMAATEGMRSLEGASVRVRCPKA